MPLVPSAELVARAKAAVPTVTCAEAAKRIREEPDLVLLDVREPEEHARGSVPGAVNVPRGLLEMKVGTIAPDGDRPILIHCAGGGRAALAAKTLQEMGYRKVVAVDGAFDELAACCARG
jgi:rhodanese-related sulfurtransferase